MPYISSTPEVLAARLNGRTDSLNPATTCRGISVSSGKPCRRNINSKAPANAKKTAPSSSSSSGGSNPAEAFFCWQHKDQAADTVVLHRTDSQKRRRLQGRTSIDTLVEVILGPDAANGGDNGGSGSGKGSGQAEVIIRRETRLSNDEVMVVSKNTLVKRDSKIMKNAKKKEDSQIAIWDALHNQQQPGPPAPGSSQPYQNPHPNHQQHPAGGYGASQAWPQQQQQQQYYPPPQGAGQTPAATYTPNNGYNRPYQPPPTNYTPKPEPSLLVRLLCCLSVEDNETPPPRPHVPAQQPPPPQMQQQQHQPARPRPPQLHTTASNSNFTPFQQRPPPPQQYQPVAPAPPAASRPSTLKFDAPAHPAVVYPPNIHVHNGWDKTPYPPTADPELDSSDSEEDDDPDVESIMLPDEAVNSMSPNLPLHLSSKTRALITTEMQKPISQKDMPGYIYIFWLKDEAGAPPVPVPASAPPTVRSFNVPQQLSPNTAGSGYFKPRKNSYVRDPGSAALFRVVEDDYDEDDEDESGAVSPTSNRKSRGASISAAPSPVGAPKPNEKRVLLKIGRAQNVQRRLHQWSQQCGYNLQLLRYYPYVPLVDSPSSTSLRSSGSPGIQPPTATPHQPSPGLTPHSAKTPLSGPQTPSTPSSLPARKVPFSHRVERLIHLELRDDYYNKPHVCETCQKVHKEWFAVPGTRDGVKRVDEVIKRWCRWADGIEGAVNKRESGGVTDGLGHRRDDSGGAEHKDAAKVTGGVRGVERMVWREGYEGQPGDGGDVDEEEEKRKTRMDRMGTFGGF